jgi:hypothetical protein
LDNSDPVDFIPAGAPKVKKESFRKKTAPGNKKRFTGVYLNEHVQERRGFVLSLQARAAPLIGTQRRFVKEKRDSRGEMQ